MRCENPLAAFAGMTTDGVALPSTDAVISSQAPATQSAYRQRARHGSIRDMSTSCPSRSFDPVVLAQNGDRMAALDVGAAGIHGRGSKWHSLCSRRADPASLKNPLPGQRTCPQSHPSDRADALQATHVGRLGTADITRLPVLSWNRQPERRRCLTHLTIPSCSASRPRCGRFTEAGLNAWCCSAHAHAVRRATIPITMSPCSSGICRTCGRNDFDWPIFALTCSMPPARSSMRSHTPPLAIEIARR